MDQLVLFALPKPCSAKGCSRKCVARGMCHLHWSRDRKANASPCSIDGCDKAESSRSWCDGHYQRWQKHGDPLGGNPSPRARRAKDNEDGTRTCLDCAVAKPLDQFPRDASATKGYRSNCKPCHTNRAKVWYAENQERQQRRQVERYHRDIDKSRARDKQRYERHKPKRIALAVEAVNRRRALMHQVEFEPGITVKALRKRHGDECCYCGQVMAFERGDGRTYVPTKATIEHVVAISKGGGHTWANTTLACWQCNVRKNAKPLDEWLTANGEVA
jgi:hypothetical protein